MWLRAGIAWCAALVIASVVAPGEISRAGTMRLAAVSHDLPVQRPRPDLLRVQIDVGAGPMQELRETRERVMLEPALLAERGRSVPATLSHSSASHPIKLRLLGEPGQSLAGDKWPFRVKMGSGEYLQGMRRFSLTHAAGGWLDGAVLPLAHLRGLGIVSPRAHLVDVTLNGAPLGSYLLRERHAKELLESQQRRDGVILRLDDTSYWNQATPIPALEPTAGYSLSEWRFDRQIMQRGSGARLQQGDVAVGLLRGFFEGRLPARDVFDLELMAHYLAAAELWQSRSATSWLHLRFYLNPTSHRIEPVGARFDRQVADDGPGLVNAESSIARTLLGDPALRHRFVAAAHDIAEDVLAGDLLSRLRAVERAQRGRRRPQSPAQAFDVDRLRRRALHLRDLRADDVAAIATPPRQAAADGTGYASPLVPQTLPDILARHDFLAFEAAGNRLEAKPGRWTVDGSLLLPPGVGLRLPAGTELRFAAGEGLVASGPLDFAGTAQKPVVLAGTSDGDPRASWAGIAVLESAAPSRWTHVHVEDTAGFDWAGWAPTGAVLFRKAPVTFAHCRFDGTSAEDALNIVRTTFALHEVHLSGTRSDAFDADFAQGTVTGGSFTDVGGDGIDVSGAEVVVRGARFAKIRDKAVSVGERSRLIASGLQIRDVGTAFVSKDRSHAELRDSAVENVAHVALMAYVKKPRFGPAELVTARNRIENANEIALAQRESVVLIDGRRVAEQDVDIDRLYESGYMQK